MLSQYFGVEGRRETKIVYYITHGRKWICSFVLSRPRVCDTQLLTYIIVLCTPVLCTRCASVIKPCVLNVATIFFYLSVLNKTSRLMTIVHQRAACILCVHVILSFSHDEDTVHCNVMGTYSGKRVAFVSSVIFV